MSWHGSTCSWAISQHNSSTPTHRIGRNIHPSRSRNLVTAPSPAHTKPLMPLRPDDFFSFFGLLWLAFASSLLALSRPSLRARLGSPPVNPSVSHPSLPAVLFMPSTYCQIVVGRTRQRALGLDRIPPAHFPAAQALPS